MVLFKKKWIILIFMNMYIIYEYEYEMIVINIFVLVEMLNWYK